MGFGNFGVVSYTKEAKVEPFVEWLVKGKVMAARCRKCGGTQFPPQVDCPRCLSEDMEWIEVSGTGRLVTYTVVHYGPIGFEDRAPYILALGAFEDGVQILAVLDSDMAQEDIRIGMSLKVVPVLLPHNRIAYQFQSAG
ncbi:MAG: Zn-ribbon domain-containing OB-fold protein [Deltaproteobacteria bacterium]|nr:Zn-ribbon domain-containing OB-fold protein [Deltaproteobacteria bacterium]MBW2120235.1 Zn-ribbon domain-containing OB-fold protein [Deltaproteobacteria bacterium]